ncbi:MAG: hypothetical protein ACHBNF_01045 [Chromatiales bacterium]
MSEIIMMALGAALMYFFDPVSGRQRRAWLRDQWDRWGGKKGTPAAPPTAATAPRYTAAEQSVPEATDRAAARPTDEALGGRPQGGEIADERGDSATKFQP